MGDGICLVFEEGIGIKEASTNLTNGLQEAHAQTPQIYRDWGTNLKLKMRRNKPLKAYIGLLHLLRGSHISMLLLNSVTERFFVILETVEV